MGVFFFVDSHLSWPKSLWAIRDRILVRTINTVSRGPRCGIRYLIVVVLLVPIGRSVRGRRLGSVDTYYHNYFNNNIETGYCCIIVRLYCCGTAVVPRQELSSCMCGVEDTPSGTSLSPRAFAGKSLYSRLTRYHTGSTHQTGSRGMLSLDGRVCV